MDTVIVGILVIVVTGVLIAIVRKRASKSRSSIDMSFADGVTHDFPSHHGSADSFDGDFGGH